MKILISGVSGSGKTTLAHELSKHFNIPFITGSTKMFWKEYFIKDHQHLIKKTITDIDFGLEFQYKCLSYRMNEFSKHPKFISDRGVIDNVVYFLAQVAPFTSSSVTADYIELANKFLKDHPHTINLLMPLPSIIHSDSARITNKYYQQTMDGIFEQVCINYFSTAKIIDVLPWTDNNRRMKLLNSIKNA